MKRSLRIIGLLLMLACFTLVATGCAMPQTYAPGPMLPFGGGGGG